MRSEYYLSLNRMLFLPRCHGMSMGITPRMRELLAYLKEREVCPSYKEIAAALKWSSTSAVHRVLQSLTERGHIIRRMSADGNARPRSIRVVEPVKIRGRRFMFIRKTHAFNSRATPPCSADKTGGALANCAPGRTLGAR
jgi:SOS-response transcriptional repressor LexA